jgi:hypothetical protein
MLCLLSYSPIKSEDKDVINPNIEKSNKEEMIDFYNNGNCIGRMPLAQFKDFALIVSEYVAILNAEKNKRVYIEVADGTMSQGDTELNTSMMIIWKDENGEKIKSMKFYLKVTLPKKKNT